MPTNLHGGSLGPWWMVEVIAVVHGPGSSLLHDCIKTGGMKQSGVERREQQQQSLQGQQNRGVSRKVAKVVDSFFSSNMQESRKRVIHRPEHTPILYP